MDRYPYLGTLYYLTSVYLRKIGSYYIFDCIFLIHITNTPIKFLALSSGILQCFMLISILSTSFRLQTFFIVVSLDLFSFFILLYICVFFL